MAVHCSQPICKTLTMLMGAAHRHCQELCVPDSVDILLHYNGHNKSALIEWCNVLPFHQAEGKTSHVTQNCDFTAPASYCCTQYQKRV